MFGWVVWAMAGWAGAAAPAACVSEPPEGWVSLSAADSGVRVDARYATSDNFTGAPLPGYYLSDAWLRADAAAALKSAATALEPHGLTLLVYDAYRPVRATEAMVAWTRRTDQEHLVSGGYIAARSGHNHGHTVDLTLVRLDGTPVDMGGPFDHFGPLSHHDATVSEPARVHRTHLRQAMEAAGFRAYSKEWWHYRFPVTETRARDVPIGCAPAPAPSTEDASD